MKLLQRNSLADQVAAVLRDGIAEGRWKLEMPSEAELCREIQISRVTLRRAIAQLVRERWLRPGVRGYRHRIRRQPAAPKSASGSIVRVLSPYSVYSLGSLHHAVLESAAEVLGVAGCRLEYELRPALFARHNDAELKRLTELPETAAWLVLYATQPMQRWFLESGMPCLLIGRPYNGIELPSIYPDVPAIARHAAGLFFQRGHREFAYCKADFTSLSDQLASEAFAQEAQRLGARARVITHRREPGDLTSKLSTALTSQARPTALFSACPEHCVTILCNLLNAGLRVPGEASLIAGWDDEFLHFAVPKIACYQVDGTKMGRKAGSILVDLIQHGPGKLYENPIVPDFIPGETLGPLEAMVSSA